MSRNERHTSDMMNKGLLSRTECEVIRGIAILGIVLHNFTHWLRFAVKENEYTFTQGKADRLYELLNSPDGDLITHLLSFFGHYGVPLFLFLSAYGLVMKYEKATVSPVAAQPTPGVWHFTRYHFLKLFKMMVVGFVLFTLVDAVTYEPHHYRLLDIVAQLGLFNNLLEHPNNVIWPGPYWFFGLMLQLYILYRLLFFRKHWGIVVAVMVLVMVMQMVCDPTSEALNRLRYNSVGGLLPFGLGLLYARYARREWSKTAYAMMFLAGSVLLFVMSGNYYAWFFVPAVVCLLGIAGVKLMPAWLMKPLEWVGNISAAMFIIHPIARKIFIPVAHRGDVGAGLLLYMLAAVGLAWGIKLLLKKIPDPRLEA